MKFMQTRFLLLAIFFAPLLVLADEPPREFSYPTMKIIVEMPERQKLEIEVDDRDVDRFAKSKYGYRIIDWVQAAFAKAKISHAEEKVSDGKVIKEIDGIRNNENYQWVFFVNGIRSPYRIDGQLSDDVQTVRFKYEKRKTKSH